MTKSDVIMKPLEVAEYLRIPITTLYRLCQAVKIPTTRIGKHWRFRQREIFKWFDENNMVGKRDIEAD